MAYLQESMNNISPTPSLPPPSNSTPLTWHCPELGSRPSGTCEGGLSRRCRRRGRRASPGEGPPLGSCCSPTQTSRSLSDRPAPWRAGNQPEEWLAVGGREREGGGGDGSYDATYMLGGVTFEETINTHTHTHTHTVQEAGSSGNWCSHHQGPSVEASGDGVHDEGALETAGEVRTWPSGVREVGAEGSGHLTPYLGR